MFENLPKKSIGIEMKGMVALLFAHPLRDVEAGPTIELALVKEGFFKPRFTGSDRITGMTQFVTSLGESVALLSFFPGKGCSILNDGVRITSTEDGLQPLCNMNYTKLTSRSGFWMAIVWEDLPPNEEPTEDFMGSIFRKFLSLDTALHS